MIKTFNVSLDKKNTIKSLITKTNNYFIGESYVSSRVVAPKDKNFVIYISDNSLELSVVEDEEYINTMTSFKDYLEQNFENQIIGLYSANDEGLSIFKHSKNLRLLNL